MFDLSKASISRFRLLDVELNSNKQFAFHQALVRLFCRSLSSQDWLFPSMAICVTAISLTIFSFNYPNLLVITHMFILRKLLPINRYSWFSAGDYSTISSPN